MIGSLPCLFGVFPLLPSGSVLEPVKIAQVLFSFFFFHVQKFECFFLSQSHV